MSGPMMTPAPHATEMADMPTPWFVLSLISYNITFAAPITPAAHLTTIVCRLTKKICYTLHLRSVFVTKKILCWTAYPCIYLQLYIIIYTSLTIAKAGQKTKSHCHLQVIRKAKQQICDRHKAETD